MFHEMNWLIPKNVLLMKTAVPKMYITAYTRYYEYIFSYIHD